MKLRVVQQITKADVAANVRAEMARRRVDQGYVAQLLRKSPTSVSERINGKTEFRIAEISAIAEDFGIPIEQLLQPAVDATEVSA